VILVLKDWNKQRKWGQTTLKLRNANELLAKINEGDGELSGSIWNNFKLFQAYIMIVKSNTALGQKIASQPRI